MPFYIIYFICSYPICFDARWNHLSPNAVTHIGKPALHCSNGVMEMLCFSYNCISTSVRTYGGVQYAMNQQIQTLWSQMLRVRYQVTTYWYLLFVDYCPDDECIVPWWWQPLVPILNMFTLVFPYLHGGILSCFCYKNQVRISHLWYKTLVSGVKHVIYSIIVQLCFSQYMFT